MSKGKQSKLILVNIVKTEGGWNVMDAKKNTKMGFCASLRVILNTCISLYQVVNFGDVLDELYKLENNID